MASQSHRSKHKLIFFLQNRQCPEMRRRLIEYLLEIWTGCHLSVQRYFFVSRSFFAFLTLVNSLICSKVVRIFTSSTFTDMLMERNTLMEYVYPKIKEYCREKHGLEYQVWTFQYFHFLKLKAENSS